MFRSEALQQFFFPPPFFLSKIGHDFGDRLCEFNGASQRFDRVFRRRQDCNMPFDLRDHDFAIRLNTVLIAKLLGNNNLPFFGNRHYGHNILRYLEYNRSEQSKTTPAQSISGPMSRSPALLLEQRPATQP